MDILVELDIFNPNACIVQAEFSQYEMGKILWMSANSTNLLKLDQQNFSQKIINDFIPILFIGAHDKLLKRYYNRGYSDHIYKLADIWLRDGINQLSSGEMFVKLFLEKNRLSFMSYLKKDDDRNILLMNWKGEIDSFGKTFRHVTGLPYEFTNTHRSLPIFWVIPGLIPFFLPTFYNLPNFVLEVK